MNRRQVLISFGAACVAPVAAQSIKLNLADITVGEFSTSLRLPENFAFVSGMPAYLSFRVGGLQIEPELSMVSFDYTVEAVDGLGTPFEKPATGRVTRRIPAEVVVVPPLVRVSVKIPEFVYPAAAKFRIRVTDRYSKQSVEGEAEIPIRSDLPPPAGRFEIVKLSLYRSESDPTPVAPPSFRQRDEIWVRFLLTGFRREEREYDLRYGLQVIGQNGRVIFDVPEASAERNASEYLKAYVPAVAAFRMERNASPGDYSLVVTAVDVIAKATAKATISYRLTAA